MWNILAFNEPCTEREKGFIDVLLMEELRDWYYTTPWKKKFNLPHFKYKKYTGYWEIALFRELPNYTFNKITITKRTNSCSVSRCTDFWALKKFRFLYRFYEKYWFFFGQVQIFFFEFSIRIFLFKYRFF